MPKISFIAPDGRKCVVEGPVGTSAMLAAKTNGIAGIEAECGGSLSCGTCHVFVASDFVARLPPPSEEEQEMLEFVATERREFSRLSCQIVLTEELDGLELQLPATQF